MSASATRTNQPTVKVSFTGVNVATDTITGLDSANYANIPITTLVTTDSAFWIESDINGIQQLCTTKTFTTPMIIRFNRGGVSPAQRTADPFIIVYTDEAGLPVYMPFPSL